MARSRDRAGQRRRPRARCARAPDARDAADDINVKTPFVLEPPAGGRDVVERS